MGQRSPAVRYSLARLFRDIKSAVTAGACRSRFARAAGFTLVELMITVAILGILAAIAIPAYTRYIVRANRTAAESFLLEVASMQERFLVDTRAYATTLPALGYASLPASVSPNYQITLITVATPPGYQLTATPIGTQATGDTNCGTLTLTGAGDKTASGAGQGCWK
ncbi:type IV pilin protein [Cupriavidus sp. RAF12]|uniref:type IV pilin protein n=1 Tax=Cupriavidus sp. RAF12 TaxID=3233050 RepID=UPI003F8FBB41